MMVDCLSPHLLGAQTLELYVSVAGLTAALRYTIITDLEPVVVILVNTLQPLLYGGPPPLPQDIGHRVHVVQGRRHTILSELLRHTPTRTIRIVACPGFLRKLLSDAQLSTCRFTNRYSKGH